MTRLILVRHGETDWNAEGRVRGGGQLNARGRAQTAALAQRLAPEHIAAIYSSPTQRTQETANPIAQPLGLQVQYRDTLVDLNYGQWSSATLEELWAGDPELARRWEQEPHTVRFPGGDSLADLRARVQSFVDEVLARHLDDTVLLVTHESPICTVVCIMLGLDDSHHRQWHVENASVTIVEVKEDGPVVVTVNDTCHLRDLNG